MIKIYDVLKKILARIEFGLVQDLVSLLNFSKAGDSSNLLDYYTSTALENAVFVTYDDVILYSFDVINNLGATQYIQIHEPGTDLAISSIANDGAGGVNVVTSAAHGYTGGESVYISVDGTPLLTGIRAVDSAVNATTFKVTPFTFVATGTGTVSEIPIDTSVPEFCIPTGDATFKSFGSGRQFPNGLIVTNSTTIATKTIGAADCWFDIIYHPTI